MQDDAQEVSVDRGIANGIAYLDVVLQALVYNPTQGLLSGRFISSGLCPQNRMDLATDTGYSHRDHEYRLVATF